MVIENDIKIGIKMVIKIVNKLVTKIAIKMAIKMASTKDSKTASKTASNMASKTASGRVVVASQMPTTRLAARRKGEDVSLPQVIASSRERGLRKEKPRLS